VGNALTYGTAALCLTKSHQGPRLFTSILANASDIFKY